MKCDWCGTEKDRMAMLQHTTGPILFLCFEGCQHLREPFRNTGLSDDWVRIDPWQAKHDRITLEKAWVIIYPDPKGCLMMEVFRAMAAWNIRLEELAKNANIRRQIVTLTPTDFYHPHCLEVED